MSSLKKECGNCHRNGVKTCVPVEVPIPDFTKLDKELACLEQQESDADVAETKALDALFAAHAKKDRLRKQRKLLKRREQQWMDESGKFVEEIEALEAVEGINQEVFLEIHGQMQPCL
jgi:chemotaxis regulatin CheY-phosphate phosphatase CheZ